MKRFIVLLCVLCLLFSFMPFAFADYCPLPETNSEATITFNGLPWYTDYYKTLENVAALGYKCKPGGGFPMEDLCFSTEYIRFPHWINFVAPNYAGGGMYGTGAKFDFSPDTSIEPFPTVAGHDISHLELYFLWNPDIGPVEEAKAEEAIQFYAACYSFAAVNYDEFPGIFEDLYTKLCGLYGAQPDKPFNDKYGRHATDYAVWVDKDQASVILINDTHYVQLVYMAPECEEKLCIVEDLIASSVKDSDPANVSGL